MPKPRELDVQTRLIFHERIVPVGPDGARALVGQPARPGHRTIRARLVRSRSSGTSFKRPRRSTARFARRPRRFGRRWLSWWPRSAIAAGRSSSSARPGRSPGPSSSSFRASATRSRSPIFCRSSRWPPVIAGKCATRPPSVMSGYDTITSNHLEATLESADRSKARIRLKGRIEGSAFGGSRRDRAATDSRPSTARWAGSTHLNLNRVETRQAGPVEAGLDMKSTLTVTAASRRASGGPVRRGARRCSSRFQPRERAVADHRTRRAIDAAGRPRLAYLLGRFQDGDLETPGRRSRDRSVQPHGRSRARARVATRTRRNSATTSAAA